MGIFDSLKGMRMKDPVRGTAQVVSCSGYRGDGMLQNCHMELVVQAEGVPATAVQFQGLVHRNKWPQPGMTLPVSVDRADPTRVKIEWDEVESGRDRGQRTAEAIAAAMRGEGGAAPMGFPAGLTPQVVNLSGRDLSQLSEEQKAKLRMLGIDPDALAAAQGQAPATPDPAATPPPMPGTQPAAQGDPDQRVALLERLARLREQGLLTEAEFEVEKKRILEA
jgi:hypothetical protein